MNESQTTKYGNPSRVILSANWYKSYIERRKAQHDEYLKTAKGAQTKMEVLRQRQRQLAKEKGRTNE